MKLEVVELDAEQHSPEMLVIPGWGISAKIMLPWLQDLQTLFRIKLVILPGNGYRSTEFKLKDLLKCLADEIDQQAIVLGWSLGGNLALELASHCAEKIQALVTIATTPKFCAAENWPHAMAQKTFDNFYSQVNQDLNKTLKVFYGLCVAGDDKRKEQLKVLKEKQEVLDHSSSLFLLKLLAEFDQRELLARCKTPLLMLFAEHDALVPCTVIQDLNNSCELIKNSGHLPFYSNSSECSSRIIRYLQNQGILDQRDKKIVALSFSRAAKSYDEAAQLQQHVADFLISKFKKLSSSYGEKNLLKYERNREPKNALPYENNNEQKNKINDEQIILDLGCGNGRVSFSLQTIEPDNLLIGLDLAEGMLEEARLRIDMPLLAGDAEQLPLARNSIDKIFSSLVIQWSENIHSLFREIDRVLKPGAFACLSTLGPETLWQLRDAWSNIDYFEHVNRFYPQQLLIEAAEDVGFTIEVEEERLDYYFDSLPSLMRSLKEIGAQNHSQYRQSGLTGKQKFLKLNDAYEQYRTEDGLPASYQVFYLSLKKK